MKTTWFSLLAVGALYFTAYADTQTFNIAIGDTVSDGVPEAGAGNIEQPGSRDIYLFDATAGQTVYLQRLAGSWPLYWGLYDPDGEQRAETWLDFDLGRSDLTKTGTYRIEVWASNSVGTGTYSFRINGLRPPEGGDDVAATVKGKSVNLPILRLLANDTDPDGDPVSFGGLPSAATSQGGSVLVVGDAVRYRPPTGFTGDDTFSYRINDSFGNSATATVTVYVRDSSQLGHNTIALVVNPDGSVDVTLAGIPGRNYQVWGASAVTGPWTNLGTATADAHGVVHFTDTTASGAPARFYHLANP